MPNVISSIRQIVESAKPKDVNCMKEESTEDLTVYPYFVQVYRHKVEAESICEKFDFDKVLENAYPKPVDSGNWPKTSIICDRRDGNKIYGRFIRLRKDAIEFLRSNGVKLSERIEFPGLGEYLEENSHFLWDITNQVILCEYNHNGMRKLSTKAESLISNILGIRNSDDFKIKLVPTDELLENLANGGSYYRANVNLPNISKSYLESIGFRSDSILDIMEYGFNMKMDLTSKISVPRNKSTIEKVFEARDLFKKIAAKNFKLYTDEGVVDLIDHNFLYYVRSISVPDQEDFSSSEERQKELRERMFSIIESLYNDHIKGLLKMLPDQKRISDF